MTPTIEEKIRQAKSPIVSEEFIEIAIRLHKLSLNHQIAFFAACGERLYPIYSLIGGQPGWRDISILRWILDEVWEISANIEVSTAKIDNSCRKSDLIIDEDDDEEGLYAVCDDSPLAEEGHDINRYTAWVLMYANNPSIELFLKIFTIPIYLLYNRIGGFIMEGNFQAVTIADAIAWDEPHFLVHKLTRLEIMKQLADLEFLAATSEITMSILLDFRANACNDRVSILGTLEEIQAMCEY